MPQSSTRVIVVAGFLGSGKTALILGLGRILAERGLRVAVVENEIGPSGIDGAILARAGFAVREVTAGCICCTLIGDLRAAVESLVREVAPDVLFIEPTGVAGPAATADAVRGCPGIDPVGVLGVVDATRIGQLSEDNPVYLEGLLAASSAVALTKIDRAGAERTAAAHAHLIAAGRTVPVLPLDSGDAGALAELADTALTLVSRSGAAGQHGVAAAAASTTAVWDPAPHDLEDQVRQALRRLGRKVAGPDGAIPGHLKAFVDAGADGWLSLSVTRLDDPGRTRGRLERQPRTVTVTLTAIVAGAEPRAVESLVADALAPRLRLA